MEEEKNDHTIKPIDLASEGIQCIEIKKNQLQHTLHISIPASKIHLSEYQGVIDKLYELYKKKHETHKIL